MSTAIPELSNIQFQRDLIDRDLNLTISASSRAALIKERDRLDLIIYNMTNNKPKPAEMTVKTPGGEICVYTYNEAPFHGIYVNINGEQAALIEHHGDDKVHKIHVWKHDEETDGDDPVVSVIFETGQLQKE